MNWNIIAEKYPNAWKLYQQSGEDFRESNDRDLYDFFDQQGIYGTVKFHIKDSWFYDLETDDKKHYPYHGPCKKSRSSAEEEMWTKQFNILEERLNK